MAQRRRHHVKTLEELSLDLVLSSIVADLHLVHLLATDLRHSCFLTALSASPPEELRRRVAARLSALPGILNDQARRRLIQQLFGKPVVDRWTNAKLDILQVLLDKSVTAIDCQEDLLPKQVLVVIGESCPALTSLKLTMQPKEEGSSIGGGGEEGSKMDHEAPCVPVPCNDSAVTSSDTQVKKFNKKKPVAIPVINPVVQGLTNLTKLSTLHMLHGATNEALATLGKCMTNLRELKVCYSFMVTDAGLKALCLRCPDEHIPRRGKHLHDLKLCPLDLTRCCFTLQEVDILGTQVTHYGIAFLLKYVSSLKSLGDSSEVAVALEVLSGCQMFLSSLHNYPNHFKLVRVREDNVSAFRFSVIVTLCPDLRDLVLTHAFNEVDLVWQDSGHAAAPIPYFKALLALLTHLRHLTLVNVSSSSVSEVVRVVGHQLTALTVTCVNLNVPLVFETCTNLKYLSIKGNYCCAPYEAVKSFQHRALTKLQVAKIRCTLPTPYIKIILNNARGLTEAEIHHLPDVNDDCMKRLIKNKCLENLHRLCLLHAPELTLDSARLLVKCCPRLQHLSDLGGWNVTASEYTSFLRDTQHCAIHITSRPSQAMLNLYTEELPFLDEDQDERSPWSPAWVM